MVEAVVMRIDPFRLWENSLQKTKFSAEGFYHLRLWSQIHGYDKCCDVPVSFTVEKVIQMGCKKVFGLSSVWADVKT